VDSSYAPSDFEPFLQQAHVLHEAVVVEQVALDYGPVVEDHRPRPAAHHGKEGAEAPGRAVGVARDLDVVPRVVDEAAGQAVEGLVGRDLPGEGGDHGLEVGARGQGARDPVQDLGAGRRNPQLGVAPRVLEAGADLLAHGLQQLGGGHGGLSGRIVQGEDAQPPTLGGQRRGGDPAALGTAPDTRLLVVDHRPGQLPRRAPVRSGQAPLRGRRQRPVGPEQERGAAGHAQGLDQVLEAGAEEALLAALHAQVVGQRDQGPDRPVLRGPVRDGRGGPGLGALFHV
jgi:hypothetical protein